MNFDEITEILADPFRPRPRPCTRCGRALRAKVHQPDGIRSLHLSWWCESCDRSDA